MGGMPFGGQRGMDPRMNPMFAMLFGGGRGGYGWGRKPVQKPFMPCPMQDIGTPPQMPPASQDIGLPPMARPPFLQMPGCGGGMA